MKVAAPFTNDRRWKDIPDEYNIVYSDTSNSTKLVDFCKLFPHKRINITFQDIKIDYNSLQLAKKYHNDISVVLFAPIEKEINKLKELGINFYFNPWTYPCYSLGLLDTMIDLGVSDIFFFDKLCYSMEIVKNKCKESNVQTRLIINTIPSFDFKRGYYATSPFFCPRDVEEIEKYVDVIEFDCGTPQGYDWHIFNVLYKAWCQDKDWFGDLREINKDLELFFPHYAYPPGYFNRRNNCEKRCLIDSNCNRCQLNVELTHSLNEQGQYIRAKKD